MKHQSIGMTLLLVGFGVIGTGFSQSPADSTKFRLKSVEWPGLGRTTAVCVEKDGLYVCVLPEGGAVKEGDPRVFDAAGKELPAKLLHKDEKHGICLLESKSGDSEGNHLPLSTRSIFEPGLALTSLLPTARLRTRLAGKDREYLGHELPSPMLRIRGESNDICEPGTPVINENGELEGLVANRKLQSPNEAHAIPAGVIRKVINDIENEGKSAPVWVGMILRSNSSTPQVIEVKTDSPAEAAGIEPHDIILQINERKITAIDDLVEVLKLLPGKKKARFTVLRDLDEIHLQVVPRFIQ